MTAARIDRIESRYTADRDDDDDTRTAPVMAFVGGTGPRDLRRIELRRLTYADGGRGLQITIGGESILLVASAARVLARVVSAMVYGQAPAGARPRGRTAP